MANRSVYAVVVVNSGLTIAALRSAATVQPHKAAPSDATDEPPGRDRCVAGECGRHAKRSALAPDIPTMAELGLPELDFGAWWAMWGPPDMAAGLVNTLNGWVNEAVKALAVDGRLEALGIEAAAKTPAEFAQYLRADLDRSAKLLKAANFVPQ